MNKITFLLVLMTVFRYSFSETKYQWAAPNENYDEYWDKPTIPGYTKLCLKDYYESKFNIEYISLPSTYDYDHGIFLKHMEFYCNSVHMTWEEYKVDYFAKVFGKIKKAFKSCLDELRPEITDNTVNKIIELLGSQTLDYTQYFNSIEAKNEIVDTSKHTKYLSCLSNFYLNIENFKDEAYQGNTLVSSVTIEFSKNLLKVIPLLRLAVAENVRHQKIKDAINKFLEIPLADKIKQIETCKSGYRTVEENQDNYYAEMQKKLKERRYNLQVHNIDGVFYPQHEYIAEQGVVTTSDEVNKHKKLVKIIDNINSTPKDLYEKLLENDTAKNIIIQLQQVAQTESNQIYSNYVSHYLIESKAKDYRYMHMRTFLSPTYNLDEVLRRIPLGRHAWNEERISAKIQMYRV